MNLRSNPWIMTEEIFKGVVGGSPGTFTRISSTEIGWRNILSEISGNGDFSLRINGKY